MIGRLDLIPAFAAATLAGLAWTAHSEPPRIGVSYYPEVAGDQIDDDIAKMKRLGVNLVRIGDHCWSRMETNEGRYDLGWMHGALEKFAKAGIEVEMCTPTTAPPVWLTEAHPEVLRVNSAGQAVGHGGRRQYCPNSGTYRGYARAIAEMLGREFGNETNVVAWQIDNELWQDCYCPRCEMAFHEWLKRRYGTIEALNREWLTVLWSQEYQSFDQIPLPIPQRVGSSHHPSLLMAYRHFMSDSYIAFCNDQAEVLRAHTRKPITTTAHNPVYQRIDYTGLFKDLDFTGVDCYAGPDNLARYAFEADWMRPLGKPFWLAETASTHSCGTAVNDRGDYANSPGALRAKMWLTYALGGDLVSFWHWRGHWAGQELEHGSLLYPWGEECANTPEVARVAGEIRTHADWLRTTRFRQPEVALTYGIPAQWMFEATPTAAGFNYDEAISGYHRTLLESGTVPDVIMSGADLSHYRVIFSPYTPVLDDATRRRFQDFVERGGTWVLGPLSAHRTGEATAKRDACYGADFQHWLGVHVRHRLPPGSVTRLSSDRGSSGCRWWCDAYQPDSPQKVLATYSCGPLDGMAAVVECPIGTGRVILLGTQPDESWLRAFLRGLVPSGGVEATPGVVAAQRVDAGGRPAGFIVINTKDSTTHFRLPGADRQSIGAYGVLIQPKK